MTFVAIMAATPEGRVAKYAEFAIEASADAHVELHSGSYPDAFTAPTPAAPDSDWLLDMAAKTLTVVPPPPPDFAAIDQATVDSLLLESGVTRAQVKTLFDHENRIRALESRPVITLAKLKTAFRKLIRGA